MSLTCFQYTCTYAEMSAALLPPQVFILIAGLPQAAERRQRS